MKQTTVGVFQAREDAEKAITTAHRELDIPDDDISYLYRTSDGDVREIETMQLSGATTGEGARRGAWIGGIAGLLLALAGIAGIAPFMDTITTLPVVSQLSDVSIQLLQLVGISGAFAAIVTAGVVGAVIGAILGALIAAVTGGGNSRAVRRYDDRAQAGEIMVAVNAPEGRDVYSLFRRLGAVDTRVYRLSL